MYGKDLELHFEEFYLDEPKFDETTSKEKTLPMRRSSCKDTSHQCSYQ